MYDKPFSRFQDCNSESPAETFFKGHQSLETGKGNRSVQFSPARLHSGALFACPKSTTVPACGCAEALMALFASDLANQKQIPLSMGEHPSSPQKGRIKHHQQVSNSLIFAPNIIAFSLPFFVWTFASNHYMEHGDEITIFLRQQPTRS